jgi:hypothetical protein
LVLSQDVHGENLRVGDGILGAGLFVDQTSSMGGSSDSEETALAVRP